MFFKDRKDAAEELSKKLLKYKDQKNTLIIALPRGGVVVGARIAELLNLPLDIVAPRKIGAPDNKELAIGAICGDVSVLKNELIFELGVDDDYIKKTIEEEKKESQRRMQVYRAGRPPLALKDKIIIIVDDGIATGATMEASLKYIQKLKPKKIILAVPVAPKSSIEYFQKIADEVICLYIPYDFMAIGQFYENFQQTSDNEVLSLMKNPTH